MDWSRINRERISKSVGRRLRARGRTLVKRLERLLSREALGYLDYTVSEPSTRWHSRPFNGQERRKELYLEIIELLRPSAVIETGTFKGTTTRYLAESQDSPVYSCELNRRKYGYALHHLRPVRRRVDLRLSDSRRFLANLAKDPEVAKTRVLFYLDAHWNDDLPLREEIEIITESWKEPVVIVDDFEVPGTDYGFDDYGETGRLSADYLNGLDHLGLKIFYPSAPVETETGAKRGCAVLCADEEICGQLAELDELTPSDELAAPAQGTNPVD
jgi:predicted O-methyltransferase YrrM